jgi:hypothetical protein
MTARTRNAVTSWLAIILLAIVISSAVGFPGVAS